MFANKLFDKCKQAFSQAGKKLVDEINSLCLRKTRVDASFFAELEQILLRADLGLALTTRLMQKLPEHLAKELDATTHLLDLLKKELLQLMLPCEQPLTITPAIRPFVCMLVGINGAGKTTTMAKLAHLMQQQNRSVLMVAADTFRAAAIAQLQAWGRQLNIPVIAQHLGADSAGVVFDALQSAQAKQQYDVVLIDTAGRLHNNNSLMQELQKIIRVIKKFDANAPHEVLLVVDGTIGQIAITQAKEFHQALQVSGIALTKLDGSAKGGSIFAVAEALQLPIRYLSVGEGVDDLKTFVAEEFVGNILS